MRTARFLVPAGMEGVYHVVSRVVDRRMAFGEEEKRHFVKLMKAYAGFSGLTLASWCVMDNHFHILVVVPEKTEEEVPESVVLQRMAKLYDARFMKEFRARLEACGTADGRRSLLRPYTRRMGDLGLFMKTLKQRFSQWFNRKHQRKGTLWEDRYHSTIVEYQGYSKPVTGTDREAAEVKSHAARVVAAYIDLNPIRAGIVDDPKDYAWSSYGAAVRGDKEALCGLQALWGDSKAKCLAEHRLFIYEEGEEEETQDDKTQDTRAGADRLVRRGIDAKKV